MAGAIVRVENADLLETTDVLTVLSATGGIAGTAVADIEDDDPKSSWHAKVRGNDLVLLWRLDKLGFMIIVQ